MKILYTSDLHGETTLYRQLLNLAGSSSAEVIILGGDLLPTLRKDGGYERMLLHQKEFIADFLLPFFKRCLETAPVRRIFLIAGNWDMEYPSVFSHPLDRVVNLNQKSHPLEAGYELIGYPFVPPTPFRPKDYEKMDDSAAAWPPQKNPSYIRSPDTGQLQPVDPRSFLQNHGTIMEDLQRLPKVQNPRKAIYVMHSPPFGTPLDLIQGGKHVGSRSIRTFIEEQQPLLTLHGHIHEAPETSGSYVDRIGETFSVNPGQSTGGCRGFPELYAVAFELEDAENTIIHTRRK